MHFSVDDNLEHISEDYLGTLSTMSLMQQRRFMEGEYADEGEGEVFKKINWGELPPASEFVDCIIIRTRRPKIGRSMTTKLRCCWGRRGENLAYRRAGGPRYYPPDAGKHL